MTKFINVYRDLDGQLHYSSEEFSINQNALNTLKDAQEEAELFAKSFKDWTYIETLTTDKFITVCVQDWINETCEGAGFVQGLHQIIPYTPKNPATIQVTTGEVF